MFRCVRFSRVCWTKNASRVLVREFRQVRGENITSHVSLEVLGTPNSESTPSLLLTSDQTSFLFNGGENIHRAFLQVQRSVYFRDIVLTGNTWNHTGGLGQIVTRIANDCERLKKPIEEWQTRIHIPGNIHLLKGLYNFEKHRHLTEHVFFDAGYQIFDDRNLNLKVFCISKQCFGKKGVTCASYVGQVKSLPGKFNGAKANMLGIPRPERNMLQDGIAVKLESGLVVQPDDVVGPPRPGTMFFIIDCPSLRELNHLISQMRLLDHSNYPNYLNMETLVVHLTPHKVFTHPRYKEFLEMFNNAEHLLFNKTVCPPEIIFQSCFEQAEKLHARTPKHCPLLYQSTHKQMQPSFTLPPNTTPASFLTKYYFRPLKKKGFNHDQAKSFVEKGTQLKPAVLRERPLSVLSNDFKNFQVVFLGTSGTMATNYRNVTGILVHLNPESSVLLDCGEGTLTQLKQHYGDAVDDVIRRIKCIFISHSHEDHILGLPSLLMYHCELVDMNDDDEQIQVVGPCHLWPILKKFSKRMAPLHLRYHGFSGSNNWAYNDVVMAAKLGITEFRTIPVMHINPTRGLVMRHKEQDWKIVYSADTRPCSQLIEYGKDATLLIHEATFDEEEKHVALKNSHSTVTEAIEVGRRMNAQNVILTHISNRYFSHKFSKDRNPSVCQAFDHLQVGHEELTEFVRSSF